LDTRNIDYYKNKIEEIGSLPTIPAVVFRVMELIGDENVSFSKLEKVIADDPPMVAKIMKVANSGFYRTTNEIKSLKMAISILGLDEIRNLVFALSLFSSFKKLKDSKYFSFTDFWKHSAGVAKVALAISKFLQLKLDEAEFVSGLLHDIGRLVLQSFFQEDYNEIYEQTIEKNTPLIEQEINVWGISHEAIGEWLAQKWALHPDICEVIAKHHTKEYDSINNKDLVAVISLADHVTKVWGVSNEPLPFMEELEKNNGYKYLYEKYSKIAKIDWEEWVGIWDMEIDEAENFIENVKTI